jgi:dTDP-4-amino-4,6-dideoxygalactose transaminase
LVHPRQRLYRTNHTGFVRAVLTGALNAGDGAERAFENAFAGYTGLHDVVPLSRGRLGVYFGVREAIRKTGRRKVVMSAFTIFDLVNMVIAAGGLPEFVDVEPASPHISAATVAAAIDDDTGCVLVTHYHTSNPQIEMISTICRDSGVFLIEDCSIALGSFVGGRHVGSFSDVAVFSFGLFKFVSTYFGGGVWFADPETRERVVVEMSEWPRMTYVDMKPYFLKGAKFSLLTGAKVYSSLTFPILKVGFLRDIEFIKNQAKNDPDPVRRNELPATYKRRPNAFQLKEWRRQLPSVEDDKYARNQRASIYFEKLRGINSASLPIRSSVEQDCFMNFPLGLSGSRDEFVKKILAENFDCAIYYYRNCAEVDAFRDFHKDLPNLNRYVDNLVVLPTYPSLPLEYVERFAEFVRKELTQ